MYPSHRPLIDLIPDNSNLDVSDEEDGFYGHDDDYLIHPKWKHIIHRTTNRVPRRIQRYLVIWLVLATTTLIAWRSYLGPQYSAYRAELADMDSTPKEAFGANVRPHFTDTIQVKTMDEKHLPDKHKRLVIIGDVHGCKKELEELLKKVEFEKGRDHLILTGDIIAKGPDSPGVVSLAQHLDASCVRGNHEDRMLLSLAATSTSHTTPPNALSHSDSKARQLAQSFTPSQLAWLAECPVILSVGAIPKLGTLVVVHAGLVPDIPLAQQDPFYAMNMRSIDAKTRMPSETRAGTPWEKLWNHRQAKLPAHARTTVVYGHDRKRGRNVERYSIGLDSGCVSGGHLTAVVIGGRGECEFVQVRCRQDYTK
ncbi:Metallo-dependent phosphatase-like protein [Massariosphaeria phaeospora]|uniref:Metallo-dependent phosphatase-like protein n=1 Tax=Massariosphaeria phaeospora TaxID=100035 RepID=A0A7C8MK08_9PLEO|nr:Metallo-dependent phosphatase-like protein [Massariosphaeria phaeospora]